MNEKNPLHICNISSKVTNDKSNKRGRPPMEEMIHFGPQPKSIILELLKKIEMQKEAKKKCTNIEVQQSHENKISFKKIYETKLQNKKLYQSKKEHINVCTKSNRNETIELKELDDNTSNDYDLIIKSKNNELESKMLFEVYPKKSQVAYDGNLTKESNTEIKEVICEISSRRNSNIKEYQNHLILHKEKQYICDCCSYACKLSSNLIKHKRIHSSEKPYLCDQCPFRSKFVNSLKVHRRIHTSERPYACKHCNYKCNSSSNLKKHCLHRHPEVLKN